MISIKNVAKSVLTAVVLAAALAAPSFADTIIKQGSSATYMRQSTLDLSTVLDPSKNVEGIVELKNILTDSMLFSITGVADGENILTATYDASSKTLTVTYEAPVVPDGTTVTIPPAQIMPAW